MNTIRYTFFFLVLLLPLFATAQTPTDTVHIDAYAEEVRSKEQVLEKLNYRLQVSEGVASQIDSLKKSFTPVDSISVSAPVQPAAAIHQKTEALPDYLAEINRKRKKEKKPGSKN